MKLRASVVLIVVAAITMSALASNNDEVVPVKASTSKALQASEGSQPVTASRRRKRCGNYGRSWFTLTQNSEARVYTKFRVSAKWRDRREDYQRSHPPQDPVFACTFRKPRTIRKLDNPIEPVAPKIVSYPRYVLSGSMVAFYAEYDWYPDLDETAEYIDVVDLRKGEVKHLLFKDVSGSKAPYSIQLTRTGSIAFAGCSDSVEKCRDPKVVERETGLLAYRRVAIVDSAGARVVDEGFDIDPFSLRRKGNKLTWKNGKTTKTAEIR